MAKNDDWKYGEIAPEAPKTNWLIYQCLTMLNEADQRRLVQKLRNKHEPQRTHAYKELVIGAYIAGQGYSPEYERDIEGKTPEWRFTHRTCGAKLLVEVVNCHLPEHAEKEMFTVTGEIITIENGIISVSKPFRQSLFYCPPTEANADHLYQKVQLKFGKYKDLATRNSLPYVVAIAPTYSLDLSAEHVRDCVRGVKWGDSLYERYPEVSGVLIANLVGDGFRFTYLQNQYALRPASLSEGPFHEQITL